MEDNILMQLMKLAGIQTINYDSIVNPDMDDSIVIQPEVDDIAPEPENIETGIGGDYIPDLCAYGNDEIETIDPSILDNIVYDIIISLDSPVIDENSEFDYRTNPAKPNGEDAEIDAYKTLGQANLDTRYVPARSGDNPLTGEKGTSPIAEKTYKDYLKDILNG